MSPGTCCVEGGLAAAAAAAAAAEVAVAGAGRCLHAAHSAPGCTRCRHAARADAAVIAPPERCLRRWTVARPKLEPAHRRNQPSWTWSTTHKANLHYVPIGNPHGKVGTPRAKHECDACGLSAHNPQRSDHIKHILRLPNLLFRRVRASNNSSFVCVVAALLYDMTWTGKRYVGMRNFSVKASSSA